MLKVDQELIRQILLLSNKPLTRVSLFIKMCELQRSISTPRTHETSQKVFPVLFNLSFRIKEKLVATLAIRNICDKMKNQVSSPTVLHQQNYQLIYLCGKRIRIFGTSPIKISIVNTNSPFFRETAYAYIGLQP